jgi:hypothetical protein
MLRPIVQQCPRTCSLDRELLHPNPFAMTRATSFNGEICNQDVAADMRHPLPTGSSQKEATSPAPLSMVHEHDEQFATSQQVCASVSSMPHATEESPPLTIPCMKTHARSQPASRLRLLLTKLDLVAMIVCIMSKIRQCAKSILWDYAIVGIMP